MSKQRKKFRFSLRATIVVVTLLCLSLGMAYRTAQSRRTATEQLFTNGFTLAYQRESADQQWTGCGFGGMHQPVDKPDGVLLDQPIHLPWLSSAGLLDLANNISVVKGNRFYVDKQKFPGFKDQDLEPISALRHVKEVQLRYNSVTDEGLKHLSHLRKLEVLALDGCNITDEGLSKLVAKLPNLRRLSLSHTQITDAGLEKLACTHLESLELQGTPITNSSLEKISTLKRLKYLSLSHTDIDQSGIELIGKLPLLEELGLEGTDINDLGEVLPELNRLKHLYLSETNVGDDCIDLLRGRKLSSLTMDATRITGKSVEPIKKLGLEYFSAEDTPSLTIEQIMEIEDHIYR